MEIQIFKMSSPYLDGGSIDEIVTNIGIFSLIKKLKNPNNKNGFYEKGSKVDSDIEQLLIKAVNKFLEDKEEQHVIREVENFNNIYRRHGYKAIKIEE